MATAANSCCCGTPKMRDSTFRSNAWTWCKAIASSKVRHPTLDKLGGTGWNTRKTRVRKSLEDMADQLLALYAARKTAQGFAFSADGNFQREFEDAFEFEETAGPEHRHRGHQARYGDAPLRWTGCSAATSATAKPKWPCARPSKSLPTASKSRCSRRRRCWRSSISKRSSSVSRHFPCDDRNA